MKTVLTIFFSLTIILTGISQNKSDSKEHMTFKSVPMNGTLDEFILKMKNKGFDHLQTENGVALLNGDFAGYKNCFLVVPTLKQKDLVYALTIMFPEKDTWSKLYGTYSNLKDLLSEKYGEPSEIIEKFKTNIEPIDEGDKMYEVKNNNCQYNAGFVTKNGVINLSISYNITTGSFVSLVYADLINSQIIREISLSDL